VECGDGEKDYNVICLIHEIEWEREKGCVREKSDGEEKKLKVGAWGLLKSHHHQFGIFEPKMLLRE